MTLSCNIPVLRTAALCAAVSMLTACGSPALKQAVGGLTGIGAGSTIAAKPAANAPQIWFTLAGRGIKFPMSQLQQRDGVTIYASKSGSQVFLRNGILIGTRGFGRDLMSADAPSAAVLRSGTPHKRSYYDLDGTDTTIRHVFTCTVERDAADASHVSEVCVADIGLIRNEYWFDSAGSVSKSRQWLSEGVGYAAVERKEG